MEALERAGIAPSRIIEAEPANPFISAESLWQISSCQPGRHVSPYVIEGRVRNDILTGIGQTTYAQNATVTAGTYMAIFWYPQIATLNGSTSGLKIVNLNASGAGSFLTIADLGSGVSYETVYGVVSGFTDKFFVHNGSLSVVLRAPKATAAGSVWIGSFTYSQLRVQNVTVGFMQNIGKEFDLKLSPNFSLKNTVENRDIVDYAGAVNVADAQVGNEKVCFALISPGAFQSLTDSSNIAYLIDVQTSVNYAWTPDISVPMLAKMAYNSTRHPQPTKLELDLCQELDDVLTGYPCIVSDADTETIKSGLAMCSGGGRPTQDVLSSLSFKWDRNRRSSPSTAADMSFGLMLDIDRPIMDLSPVYSFLSWVARREGSIIDFDTLPPEILDLYDEFEALRDDLINRMKSLQTTQAEYAQTIRNLPCREYVKHGKTTLQYFYDEDWHTWEYVWSRLSASELESVISLPDTKRGKSSSVGKTSISLKKST